MSASIILKTYYHFIINQYYQFGLIIDCTMILPAGMHSALVTELVFNIFSNSFSFRAICCCIEVGVRKSGLISEGISLSDKDSVRSKKFSIISSC